MQIAHAALTDPGIGRARNEDSFGISEAIGLFVVCDGVGGRSGGNEASAAAVETVRSEIEAAKDLLAAFAEAPESTPATSKARLSELVEGAIQKASQVVFRKGSETPALTGMATTIVSLVLAGDQAFVAHVGDSRIYLLRGGALHQLTEDHSLMNELLRRGRLSESDQTAAFRGALTRAVGVMETVRVDMLDLELLPGDRFLLCSDGVHGVVPDAQLQAILAQGDPKDTCQALVDAALQRGGPDNATCIVVDVIDDRAADRAYRVRMRLQALQSLSLFRYLPYSDLMRVASIAREVLLAPGDVVMREGEFDDTLYVILEGTVAVVKGGVEIAVLEPGAQFGEMSLIDREVRSASVTAREPTSLLVIRREDFFALLREEATAVKLLWGLLRVLSSRIRTTSEELSNLKAAAFESVGYDTTQDVPVPHLDTRDP